MNLIPLLFTGRRVISDTFNRADSVTNLGTAETGQTWVPRDSTVWGILNGRAYCSTVPGRVSISATLTDSYTVQVTFSTISSGTNVQRVCFRYQDINNEFFFGKLNATQYVLSKRVANTVTNLVTVNQTPASGDFIRVEVVKNRVTVFLNGAQVAQTTDPDLNSANGFALFAVDNTSTFDNFFVDLL